MTMDNICITDTGETARLTLNDPGTMGDVIDDLLTASDIEKDYEEDLWLMTAEQFSWWKRIVAVEQRIYDDSEELGICWDDYDARVDWLDLEKSQRQRRQVIEEVRAAREPLA